MDLSETFQRTPYLLLLAVHREQFEGIIDLADARDLQSAEPDATNRVFCGREVIGVNGFWHR